MNFHGILNDVQKILRDNSPTILTSLGVSGTIGTAYLAGRASYQAAKRLHQEDHMLLEYMTKRQIIEEVWDLYVPALITGATTVGCILGANHISSHRAAAAYSLVAVSEKALVEYRDKVVEIHGDKKEQAVRDAIAQDRITNNPPPQVIIGSGNVLCCELFTNQYFYSDHQTLLKAQNDINAKLLRDDYATLDDFYYMVGLKQTTESGRLGWESTKLMELELSSALTDDGRPCLTFSYNYTKPFGKGS